MHQALQLLEKMKDISWFGEVCAANGLVLSDEQKSMFEMYRQLLVHWNSQINLISRRDEENFYPNHALNSISFLFVTRLFHDACVMDLGTGGGLPGIPLKIILPQLQLTMLDSILKKTMAVQAIVSEMKIADAVVVTGRAEEIAKKREFEHKFDYVVSRAAGKLDDVAKWSRGFLVEPGAPSSGTIHGGTLIVLKGGKFNEELKHARSLKFIESVEVRDIIFDGMDEVENKEKKLVIIEYKSMVQSVGRKN